MCIQLNFDHCLNWLSYCNNIIIDKANSVVQQTQVQRLYHLEYYFEIVFAIEPYLECWNGNLTYCRIKYYTADRVNN